MTTYIYTRYSPKNKAHSEHLAALREAAPDALHFEDKNSWLRSPFRKRSVSKT